MSEDMEDFFYKFCEMCTGKTGKSFADLVSGITFYFPLMVLTQHLYAG